MIEPKSPVGETPDTYLLQKSLMNKTIKEQIHSYNATLVPATIKPPFEISGQEPVVPTAPPTTNNNAFRRTHLKIQQDALDDNTSGHQDIGQFLQLVKGTKHLSIEHSLEKSYDSNYINNEKIENNINDSTQKNKEIDDTQTSLIGPNVTSEKKNDDEIQIFKSLLEQEKNKNSRLIEELELLREQKYINELNEEGIRQKITKGTKLSSNILSREELDKIEKEIKEQEIIIKGYQKENERLSLDIKEKEIKFKEKEQSLLQQNVKFNSELAQLKEEYNRKLNDNTKNTRGVFDKQWEQEKTNLIEQFNVKEKQYQEEILKLKYQAEENNFSKGDKLLNKKILILKEEFEEELYLKSQKILEMQDLLRKKDQIIHEKLITVENLNAEINYNNQRTQELERQLLDIKQANLNASNIRNNKEDLLQKNIKQLQEKVIHLEKEKSQVQTSNNETIQILQKERDNLKLENQKQNQSIKQKLNRIKELETTIETIRNTYRKKINTNPSPSSNGSNKNIKKNEQESNIEITDQHNSSQILDKNIVALHQEIYQVEFELKRKEALCTEQSKEIFELKNLLNSLEFKNEHYNKQQIQLQQQIEILENEKKKLQLALQSNEIEKSNATELMQVNHNKAMEQIRELKQLQNKEIQHVIDDQKKQLETLQSLQQVKQTQLTIQQDNIEKLERELEESRNKINKLKKKIKKLKTEQLPDIATEKDRNEYNRLSNLQKALESSQELLSQLKERNSLLEVELQHKNVRKEMVDQLQLDLKIALQENISLKERISLLQSQIDEIPKSVVMFQFSKI